MKRFFGTAIAALLSVSVFAIEPSESIPLRKRGGVYEVPATLNGEIKVYFVVDSGAADVTLSQSLAKLLAKNESLVAGDIVGSKNYTMANGDVSVGTVVTIRQLELGGIKLNNVQAVVIAGNDTPLLLGQSVLSRLAHWTLNQSENTLEISSNDASDASPSSSKVDTSAHLEMPDKPWVLLSESETSRVYANEDSIKKLGNNGSVWLLIDDNERSKTGSQSVKYKLEFDCSKETSRTADFLFLRDHNGNGEVVSHTSDESTWGAVVPDSTEADLFNVVCKHAPLDHSLSETKMSMLKWHEEREKKTHCFILERAFEKVEFSDKWADAVDVLQKIKHSCNGISGSMSAVRLAQNFSRAYFGDESFDLAIDSANDCIKLSKAGDSKWIDCHETKMLSLGKMGHMSEAYVELNALVSFNLKKAKAKRSEMLVERHLDKRFQLESEIDELEATEPRLYFRLGKFDMAIESANQCLAAEPSQFDCLEAKGGALNKKNDMPDVLLAIDSFIEPYEKTKILPLKKMLADSKDIQAKDALRAEIEKRETTLAEMNKFKDKATSH